MDALTLTKTADNLDEAVAGAKAIGALPEVNLTPEKARYALDNGYIPAWKRGRIWVTTRRHIRENAKPRGAR
jgi:hypothetical protein